MAAHSARSRVATGVRPAKRPGQAATRIAKASAPAAISVTVREGTAGAGTTLICRANAF